MASRKGPCHVVTTKRVVGEKVYLTTLLRRTYRENGKVKNETLANLSPTFPSSRNCSKGIYPLEEYYEFFNDYAAAGAS